MAKQEISTPVAVVIIVIAVLIVGGLLYWFLNQQSSGGGVTVESTPTNQTAPATPGSGTKAPR